MNVVPQEDRILVQVTTTEQLTKSGLVASVNPQRLTTKLARVVAVGDGPVACKFREGATIIMDFHAGTAHPVEGVEYLFLTAKEGLGVVCN